MVLYFSNSLSSLHKDINLLFLFLSSPLSLNILIYPLILGNIKTSGLTTSSKYPIKHLELFFVTTNFEMIILSTLTSQFFIGFFRRIRFFFCYLYLTKSQHYNTIKKMLWHYLLAN